MRIHSRCRSAPCFPTRTLLLLLTLLSVPGFSTMAEAQITSTNWWWSPVPHADGYYVSSALPQPVIERLGSGSLPLAQVLAQGLTIEGQGQRQDQFVFSVLHLRNGDVVTRFTTAPARPVDGRVQPGALGLATRLPGGVVNGVESVRMHDRMIVKGEDLTGSNRVYPVPEFLERTGALANVNWERNEALYILPMASAAEQRGTGSMRGMLILFEPTK
jgi:hypothetical protein